MYSFCRFFPHIGHYRVFSRVPCAILIRKEDIFLHLYCNNIDGPQTHYDKRDKSDRERQILYYITYIWSLKNYTDDIHAKQKQGHR